MLVWLLLTSCLYSIAQVEGVAIQHFQLTKCAEFYGISRLLPARFCCLGQYLVSKVSPLEFNVYCDKDGIPRQNYRGDSSQIYGPSFENDNRLEETDIRVLGETSTVEPDVVTVPGGKRIFSAAANCGPGYRDDGHGKCRQDFS